jgi:hypothetical protein
VVAVQTAAQALDRLDDAHARLLRQTDLQFQLTRAAPERNPFIEWLKAHMGPIGRGLDAAGRFVGPLAPYIFWAGVAIAAAWILFLIGQRLFAVRPGLAQNRLKLGEAGAVWRPQAEEARALLEDADRLAADGLFVEAAHLILLRSIQDIKRKRPRAVEVSLTSREIARLEVLPPPARILFADIAEAVERSVFGGQPLGREDFAACRDAYQRFAETGGWA